MSRVPRTSLRGPRPRLPRLRTSHASHLARILFAVALVAIWLAWVVPGARAEGEGNGSGGEAESGPRLTKTTMQLMQPFADELSGPAWLFATGQDPRLKGRAPDLAAPGVLSSGQGSQAPAANAQALVPFRSPGPAFSRNLLISRDVGNSPVQVEPSIAVDPTDPNHLVMAAIDYNLPTGMGVYTSFDAGVTWQGPSQALMNQGDIGSFGDPVLAFGRDGTVYLAQLGASAQEFEFGSIQSAILVMSINLTRSTDGGVTWSDTTRAAAGQVRVNSQLDQAGKEHGTFTYDFLDKPWISIGPDPKDATKDQIYLTYTEFRSTAGVLYADEVPFLNGIATTDTVKLVSSSNGGQTWTSPVSVSPTATFPGAQSEKGDPGAPGGNGAKAPNAGVAEAKENLEAFEKEIGAAKEADAAQIGVAPGTPAQRYFSGSQPKVLSDGTVVVTYMDSTADGFTQGYANIMVTTSPDAGRHWTGATVAGTILETSNARGAAFRYNGTSFPQMAIGPKNEIYIVAGSRSFTRPTDDGDIYFFSSLDHGKTWSPGKKLNGDDTDRLQFYPSIAVSPNGVVHAMWGDMRDDPQKIHYNIYYSESKDQGKTWGFTIPQQNFSVPDTRVSDFASNSLKGFPGGAFIGDYFSITATNDDVFMVWPDSRLAEFGGIQQRIGFARQKAIPAPTIFLNPASGAAGRTVALQGLGFQPNTILTVSVGNVPQIQLLTDDRGNFSKTIFMPITGEGAQEVDAVDETGNVAIGSFYADFGFDTIQKEIQGGAVPPAGTPAALPAGSPMATPVTGNAPPPTPTPYSYSLPQPQQTANVSSTAHDTRTIGTFVSGMFAVGGAGWWVTRRRKRNPFL